MTWNKVVKSVKLKSSDAEKLTKIKKPKLGICFKCSKETNYCPWINGNKHWLCSKCYRQWIAIKAKHYQLAVKEFLAEAEVLTKSINKYEWN